MQKWEYKIATTTYGTYSNDYRSYDDAWVGELNKQGKNGWELIKYETEHYSSQGSATTRLMKFYLKRLVR